MRTVCGATAPVFSMPGLIWVWFDHPLYSSAPFPFDHPLYSSAPALLTISSTPTHPPAALPPGCELITHPSLLFLDEPTSGLDAAAAFHVMANIRRLAEHNRTVVTVRAGGGEGKGKGRGKGGKGQGGKGGACGVVWLRGWWWWLGRAGTEPCRLSGGYRIGLLWRRHAPNPANPTSHPHRIGDPPAQLRSV